MGRHIVSETSHQKAHRTTKSVACGHTRWNTLRPPKNRDGTWKFGQLAQAVLGSECLLFQPLTSSLRTYAKNVPSKYLWHWEMQDHIRKPFLFYKQKKTHSSWKKKLLHIWLKGIRPMNQSAFFSFLFLNYTLVQNAEKGWLIESGQKNILVSPRPT